MRSLTQRSAASHGVRSQLAAGKLLLHSPLARGECGHDEIHKNHSAVGDVYGFLHRGCEGSE